MFGLLSLILTQVIRAADEFPLNVNKLFDLVFVIQL